MLGKKIFVSILVLSLILSVTAFTDNSVKSEPRTITVPDEYSTIQMAVDSANAGDTIFVRSGTYAEHVVVDKSVSVSGENAGTTVIDGGGAGTVIRVTADDVSVSGFTVRNGEVGLDIVGNGANVSSSIFTSNGLVNTDLRTANSPENYSKAQALTSADNQKAEKPDSLSMPTRERNRKTLHSRMRAV